MAAVVSETSGFLADAPALPGWEGAARGLASPGCVFHFRRATGAYASREYRFEYSRQAMKGPKGWRPLVYNVPVVVTRPTADGGTETLPERLAIRAVCLMPRSDRGTAEAIGRVEAILEAMGILEAKKVMAGVADLPVPKGAEPSWALAALGWARGRLSPRPLSAAQEECTVGQAEAGECAIAIDELVATGTPTPIPISCPAGFDYQGTTNSCVLTSNISGGGVDPGGTNSGSSGNGNTGGGDGETGTRTVEFALTCSLVPRGSSSTCSVSAPGEDLGTLEFAWSSSAGGSVAKTLGKSSWSGTAVSPVTVTVTITDPAGAIAGATRSAPATAFARDWSFPQSAIGDDDLVHTTGLAADAWGLFSFVIPGFSESTGTGPWTGVRYVTMDAVAEPALYLHSDLSDSAPDYSTWDNAVATALLKQYCSDWRSLGGAESVPGLNGTCGASAEYGTWAGYVLAHERLHETRYNECAAAVAADLKELEALLNARIDEEFDDLTVAVAAAVEDGMDAVSGGEQADVWHHREEGAWTRGATVVGHVGVRCK